MFFRAKIDFTIVYIYIYIYIYIYLFLFRLYNFFLKHFLYKPFLFILK